MTNSTVSYPNSYTYKPHSSGQISYITNQNISGISVKNVKRNNIQRILP